MFQTNCGDMYSAFEKAISISNQRKQQTSLKFLAVESLSSDGAKYVVKFLKLKT